MAENYDNAAPRITDPGWRHAVVVPHDTAPLDPRPRALYVSAGGTLVLNDGVVDVSYVVVAGQVLPFRPVRVNATGTTATVIAWW